MENIEITLRSDVGAEMGNVAIVCSSVLTNLSINIVRIAPEIPHQAMDLINRKSLKCMTVICELDEKYYQENLETVKRIIAESGLAN